MADFQLETFLIFFSNNKNAILKDKNSLEYVNSCLYVEVVVMYMQKLKCP